ncbi:uncharacterized protein LOC134247143 [Saccostrea cucullata]|uniref:uncharacterized protein LOC134247143 n=1 Tax=Saccostrea cuccullata TaxID=36930 RepID=UPI002ED22159
MPPDTEGSTFEDFLDDFDNKYPTFIPGLDARTLANIGEKLNKDEAKIFGRNLGLSRKEIELLLKTSNPATQMLLKYRGKLTNHGQKNVIINSLKTIGRPHLVSLME